MYIYLVIITMAVYYHYIFCLSSYKLILSQGTMEQKMYERSVTKQAVACRVVDEQQIDRHYNMAELSELYRFVFYRYS